MWGDYVRNKKGGRVMYVKKNRVENNSIASEPKGNGQRSKHEVEAEGGEMVQQNTCFSPKPST
jgi:hypothetical protein